MIYFTADLHLGHKKIIEYCDRPFRDIDEMDSELIRRWNEVVDYHDTIFVIGDFTLKGKEDAQKYFSRLNGNITVIPGSHDENWWIEYGDANTYQTLNGKWVRQEVPIVVLRTKEYNTPPIVMCHYAMKTWEQSHRGYWHLFGHSHGRLRVEDSELAMDVGVDCHNFYPISILQVAKIMNRKKISNE